jgi:hypothetical protein
MDESNDISGIADASKPSAGRIYDYLIGGHHNFEIDRKAAEKVLEVAPFFPQALRLIRWFLGEATRRLSAEGFDKFLDFASGLPTVDHIHEIASSGTKVIYSDIDPVTVAYSQEIIGNNADVRYVYCKAENPEALLKSSVVEEIFGKERKIAIGFNGIAYFLTDEDIKYSLTVLYEWAEKGSKIFLCDGDATEIPDTLEIFKELYKNIGQPLYLRSKKTMLKLCEPWRLEDPGAMPLENWIDMDSKVQNMLKDSWSGGGFYGMIMSK